jgi:NADH:ubiquinone oxidoreductase subunit E
MLKICVGTSCHLKGSYNVVTCFQRLIEQNQLHGKVEVQLAFCMKHCQEGVCVSVDDRIFSVMPESSEDFFQDNVLPVVGESGT